MKQYRKKRNQLFSIIFLGILILGLIPATIPFLTIEAVAHYQLDMQLEYDFGAHTLAVTIYHESSDQNNQYITKVEIEKNSVLYDTFLYTNWQTKNIFIDNYRVEAEVGDELRLTAFCNSGDSLKKSITVLGDNSISVVNDAEETDNQHENSSKPIILDFFYAESCGSCIPYKELIIEEFKNNTSLEEILSVHIKDVDKTQYLIEWRDDHDYFPFPFVIIYSPYQQSKRIGEFEISTALLSEIIEEFRFNLDIIPVINSSELLISDLFYDDTCLDCEEYISLFTSLASKFSEKFLFQQKNIANETFYQEYLAFINEYNHGLTLPFLVLRTNDSIITVVEEEHIASSVIYLSNALRLILNPEVAQYRNYNFSGWSSSSSHKAYDGILPWSSPYWQLSWIMNLFGKEVEEGIHYLAMAKEDGVMYPSDHQIKNSPFQQFHYFRFKITQDARSISLCNVAWVGNAENFKSIALYTWNPFFMFLGRWQLVDKILSGSSSIELTHISESFYLDDENYVNLLVVVVPLMGKANYIQTDYVNINVKYTIE